MAHFDLIAALFLIPLGGWRGGGGGEKCLACFKIVAQTQKYTTVLQPSLSNDGPTISAMSVFVF